MKKRLSAYEIPFAKAGLSETERREAIVWWQRGEMYHPLTCPVCGNTLSLSARGVSLECPTMWCSYTADEIPWAVFVAYQRQRTEI